MKILRFHLIDKTHFYPFELRFHPIDKTHFYPFDNSCGHSYEQVYIRTAT